MGFKANDDDARYGNVNEGRPNVNWVNRDNDNQNVRFRPAVIDKTIGGYFCEGSSCRFEKFTRNVR